MPAVALEAVVVDELTPIRLVVAKLLVEPEYPVSTVLVPVEILSFVVEGLTEVTTFSAAMLLVTV